MNGLGSRPSLPGRFKWGRLLSLAGAAGLCVSFFMPQIVIYVVYGNGGGRLEAFAPVDYAIRGDLNLLSICLPFMAVILQLPFLVVRAVPRFDRMLGVGKFLAWTVCMICLSVQTIALAWMTYSYVPVALGTMYAPPLVYAIPTVGVATLALAIGALVRSPLPRKAAAAQFALWAFYLSAFAIAGTDQTIICAGMWLSLAASGMLAIGSAIDWFQCRPGLNR